MVSLPYYQTAHLPETMVLAHEMGHVAEMDLELSGALAGALDAVPDAVITPERKAVWERCRIEAFADVFGATVGGIAFCRALASFLARDRDSITEEKIGDSKKYAYSSRYLRVLMVLEVLRRDGTRPESAGKLEAEWRSAYGDVHRYQSFESDLPSLVKCFVDEPFEELGNRSIRTLCGLAAADETQAAKDAGDMLEYSTTPEATDPRLLFAAAALAYDRNPEQYTESGVEELVLERIAAVADNAPRKATNVAAASQQADRQSGVTLAGLLGKPAVSPNE